MSTAMTEYRVLSGSTIGPSAHPTGGLALDVLWCCTDSRSADETAPHRLRDCRRSVGDTELHVGPLEVSLDRGGAHPQLAGDHLSVPPSRREPQHLDRALRQCRADELAAAACEKYLDGGSGVPTGTLGKTSSETGSSCDKREGGHRDRQSRFDRL